MIASLLFGRDQGFFPARFNLYSVRRVLLSIPLLLVFGITSNASTPERVIDGVVALPPDTTADLSWAGRLIRLHSTLAEIGGQPGNEAASGLVAAAFEDARTLAQSPGMLESASFRSMYLNAHRLYEQHHYMVAPIALSGAELSVLRAAQFAQLASVDPTLLQGVDLRQPVVEQEPEREQESVIPSILRVPASAEAAVAAHQRRIMRQYGGFGGMRRASRGFFPMIARALRRRGVPAELKYVAVIESSLDPNAESGAGAIGLWQFMPETGAMYGLSEDDLRSPSRSTSAAAHHLQRLGTMFNGDWQLALAAYNSGGGRVRSAVRQARRRLGRQPTFWDIYHQLPAETRNYVPKFIATARVMGS